MPSGLSYVFNDSIFQPGPGEWDHTVDEREHTVEQWKDLIYREVTDYERTHNTLGPGSASSAASGSRGAASTNAKMEADDEVMQHASSRR